MVQKTVVGTFSTQEPLNSTAKCHRVPVRATWCHTELILGDSKASTANVWHVGATKWRRRATSWQSEPLLSFGPTEGAHDCQQVDCSDLPGGHESFLRIDGAGAVCSSLFVRNSLCFLKQSDERQNLPMLQIVDRERLREPRQYWLVRPFRIRMSIERKIRNTMTDDKFQKNPPQSILVWCIFMPLPAHVA